MSSGTFSLLPGVASPEELSGTWAGTMAPGYPTGTGFTSVASLCLDVAALIPEAPTEIVQQAYIRSARDFCKKTMWLRRNINEINLTVDQPLYNFGTDSTGNLELIGVSAASVQQANGTWFNLYPQGASTWDLNRAPDLPLQFSYLPEGLVRFYPTPNYAYLSNLNAVCQVGISAANIPNDLVEKFNLYIESGALMFLRSMRGKPWLDPNSAQTDRDTFDEGIGAARSWVSRGYQAGSVRAPPRAFIAR